MSSQHCPTNECRGLCNYFISFKLAIHVYFRYIPVKYVYYFRMSYGRYSTVGFL